MPKGRFATLTSWSFSVYTQYKKCPFSVCLDKIMRVRIQEPENPHFVKGDRAHAITDVYISGEGKKRPGLVEDISVGKEKVRVDLRPIANQLADLRTKKARTEQEWAFDKDYNQVDWRDWARAWLRIKTDVCADTKEPPMVEIVDWKTGRMYDDHRQQRSLYALGGLQLVQIGVLAGGGKDVKLTAQHVYVDTGLKATESFKMKDLTPLKKQWAARIKQMMSDTTYPTKTGYHCRYCRFAQSKGGPCPEKM
jgi:PD-(D/E)XK nuclease superfamily